MGSDDRVFQEVPGRVKEPNRANAELIEYTADPNPRDRSVHLDSGALARRVIDGVERPKPATARQYIAHKSPLTTVH